MLRRKQEQQAPERPRRIRNMETPDLRGWLNTSLMELGMVFDQWQFHDGDPREVDRVLAVVNDLWAELQSRS